MADAVNLSLENSVEEAEQLLKCSTFSSREVQMIFQHRTRFEYMFRRRRVPASRFMSAIRFETDLHKLHSIRKRQTAGGSSALANTVGHAFIRKIHTLYQRVLRKYPGNVGLWLDFASFCFSHGNARLLSEVVSQGLLLNPQCAGLWCFAANWEYKHKGDISAARHLLLRGLRNCGQSKILWQVYFRFELKYAGDVHKRNEILRISTVPSGEHVGAVAQCVFEAAMRVHPTDTVFHTQFVYVTASFPWAKELKENMIEVLTRQFEDERDGDDENKKGDAALYKRLLSSASNSDGVVSSCGALVSEAVTHLISSSDHDSDRTENVINLTNEVFGETTGSKEKTPKTVDRLRLSLLGAANALRGSAQQCTAFAFDRVLEATAVTQVLKDTQPGAAKYHQILTGAGDQSSTPADVAVSRDEIDEDKKAKGALEKAVLELLADVS